MSTDSEFAVDSTMEPVLDPDEEEIGRHAMFQALIDLDLGARARAKTRPALVTDFKKLSDAEFTELRNKANRVVRRSDVTVFYQDATELARMAGRSPNYLYLKHI